MTMPYGKTVARAGETTTVEYFFVVGLSNSQAEDSDAKVSYKFGVSGEDIIFEDLMPGTVFISGYGFAMDEADSIKEKISADEAVDFSELKPIYSGTTKSRVEIGKTTEATLTLKKVEYPVEPEPEKPVVETKTEYEFEVTFVGQKDKYLDEVAAEDFSAKIKVITTTGDEVEEKTISVKTSEITLEKPEGENVFGCVPVVVKTKLSDGVELSETVVVDTALSMPKPTVTLSGKEFSAVQKGANVEVTAKVETQAVKATIYHIAGDTEEVTCEYKPSYYKWWAIVPDEEPNLIQEFNENTPEVLLFEPIDAGTYNVYLTVGFAAENTDGHNDVITVKTENVVINVTSVVRPGFEIIFPEIENAKVMSAYTDVIFVDEETRKETTESERLSSELTFNEDTEDDEMEIYFKSDDDDFNAEDYVWAWYRNEVLCEKAENTNRFTINTETDVGGPNNLVVTASKNGKVIYTGTINYFIYK